MMSKFKQRVDDWREIRMDTTSCLQNLAEKLERSHRRNAESEHTSAATALLGGRYFFRETGV